MSEDSIIWLHNKDAFGLVQSPMRPTTPLKTTANIVKCPMLKAKEKLVSPDMNTGRSLFISTSPCVSEPLKRSLVTTVIGSSPDLQPRKLMFGKKIPVSPVQSLNSEGSLLDEIEIRIGTPFATWRKVGHLKVSRVMCSLDIMGTYIESIGKNCKKKIY